MTAAEARELAEALRAIGEALDRACKVYDRALSPAQSKPWRCTITDPAGAMTAHGDTAEHAEALAFERFAADHGRPPLTAIATIETERVG